MFEGLTHRQLRWIELVCYRERSIFLRRARMFLERGESVIARYELVCARRMREVRELARKRRAALCRL